MVGPGDLPPHKQLGDESPVLRVDRATSPLDGRQQCPPRSEVPPRTIERPRGSAQPPQPGPGGGVVSS